MKSFVLLTVGAIVVYVALSGRAAQVGTILRGAIFGSNTSTPAGSTPTTPTAGSFHTSTHP